MNPAVIHLLHTVLSVLLLILEMLSHHLQRGSFYPSIKIQFEYYLTYLIFGTFLDTNDAS